MLSKKFRAAYAGAAVLYLAAGATSLAFALLLMERTSSENITALLLRGPVLRILLASGIITLLSGAIGLAALHNTIERRGMLRLYGGTIVAVVALQLTAALIIWFETLMLRDFIGSHWLVELTSADVADFQEQLRCCGFLNGTDRAVESPFCPANAAATRAAQGCKEPVASQAQQLLQDFYTAGFAAIVVDFSAFLCCVIMAQYRQDYERFKKIDDKNLVRKMGLAI